MHKESLEMGELYSGIIEENTRLSNNHQVASLILDASNLLTSSHPEDMEHAHSQVVSMLEQALKLLGY